MKSNGNVVTAMKLPAFQNWSRRMITLTCRFDNMKREILAWSFLLQNVYDRDNQILKQFIEFARI